MFHRGDETEGRERSRPFFLGREPLTAQSIAREAGLPSASEILLITHGDAIFRNLLNLEEIGEYWPFFHIRL